MYSDLGGNAQSFTYTFDPQNRLKKWQNGAGLACAFGLDRYGNLGDASGNPSCGMLTGRSFNLKNQVVGYVYDGAGQVLSDTAGTSYGWNVEGQLSGFQTTGQPAVGFLYDALGNRVEKTVNGAVVANYIHNALGDMVDELDGAQYTDFVYAPAGALHGEPGARIAAVTAGGVSTVDYYHTDALGTSRVITDAVPPAGNNIASCGQNSNYAQGSFLDYATPFKFTGKYRDAETGLDNFGARLYQSNLGRFLSPDPGGGDPSNPQSLNLYS